MHNERFFSISLLFLLQNSAFERNSNGTHVDNFSRRLCATGFLSTYRIEIEGVSFTRIENSTSYIALECDVVIEFENRSSRSPLNCPGYCFPTPVVKITLKEFEDALNNRSKMKALCSLPLHEFFDRKLIRSEMGEKLASKIFEIIYYRRLMECREKQDWPVHIPSKYAELRLRFKGGLFIWVGTNGDMETLYLQQSVLSNSQMKGIMTPVSWLATEDVYPCHSNLSTLCQGGYVDRSGDSNNSDIAYLPFMPPTGTI